MVTGLEYQDIQATSPIPGSPLAVSLAMAVSTTVTGEEVAPRTAVVVAKVVAAGGVEVAARGATIAVATTRLVVQAMRAAFCLKPPLPTYTHTYNGQLS